MRVFVVYAVALAGAVGGRLAADEPKSPPPVSPVFVQVEAAGKDTNGDGEKLLSCLYVQPRVTFVPDPNKKGAYTRVVTKELAKVVIPLDRLVATTAAGKAVDAGPGWEKLVGRTAVLQDGGFPLDPAVMKLLAPDTLVLTERPAARK